MRCGHVRPVSTDFAWLSPDLAQAFCSEPLQLDPDRNYGDFRVAHLGMGERFDAALLIQDLIYLGDTGSAADFDIFHRMPPERLCLGCGIRSDETFCPLPPQERFWPLQSSCSAHAAGACYEKAT